MSRRSGSMSRRYASLMPSTSAAAAAVSNAKNRRFSLNKASTSSTVYCEGYARIKRQHVLTWSTRFLVLTNSELLLFYNKHDACYRRNVVDTLELVSGRLSSKYDFGVEFKFADGRELVCRVFSRADQAQWVSAFYQLTLRKDVRRMKSLPAKSEDDEVAGEKRRVSFFGNVAVRTIPTLPDDQVPKLFYSTKDVEKFSERASSLRSRTGDAVCHVFRKPSLPWRRQVV
ncbi:hypothetical protein PsorP6_017706 [Peronosclerospora sorghi]|uniref:Uncharacterized protein n=1 Tax=Peronosclerospora sorghi TaxID=230839 RepID=A0ACC0WKM5_9STRA|nr:hypothetical protein PsorP6_017706 [Peronosclerospora sorghi]